MDPLKAEGHVLRSLTSALTKKRNGDSKEYNRVLKALEASPTATLVFWFRALVKCISLVDPSCKELVVVLLRYKFDGGASANEAFEKMLINLISSNQRYAPLVCEQLVLDLIPPKVEEGQVLQESDLIGHFAEAIAVRIMETAPTTTGFFIQSLQENFPNLVNSAINIDQYTMHMLSIANCKVLRDRILQFLIIQSVDIDAQIPDEVESDVDQDLLFDLDEGPECQKKNQRNEKGIEMAEKLDNMMSRLFYFLDMQCEIHKSTEEVFRLLIQVFDDTILPTQKTKHAQFLIFFVCSKNFVYTQRFLGYLIQKTMDSNSSQFIKAASIGFIGSFISRAKFLSPSLMHSTITTLCSWASLYAKENSEDFSDFATHRIFYQLCQAIFYIFCFRFDHILDRMTKEECLNTFNLVGIITSSLNPFKYCTPFVVKELTEMSRYLEVTRLVQACDDVLLHNKEEVTTVKYIESSFPFDPYLLKSSSQWIDDIYCAWEDKANYGDDSSFSEELTDEVAFGSLQEEFDMMSFTPDSFIDAGMNFSRE